MARPTEYNLELCEEVCNEIREGGSIKAILKKKRKYPSFPTWCKWKRENVVLLNLYVGAMQDKAEAVLEQIEVLEQEVRDKTLSYSQGHLLINTLKWKASKFYPKMFGNNSSIDVTSEGKQLTQQIAVFELPSNGRDKIKPTEEEKEGEQ